MKGVVLSLALNTSLIRSRPYTPESRVGKLSNLNHGICGPASFPSPLSLSLAGTPVYILLCLFRILTPHIVRYTILPLL
ncbi:hypothetical protein ARMSODRAFT_663063 [Armillaria solidipes]|uniref:Uncharacterized protein n=1 Tax=Armillaria solidipes TaxID=1076256 RepID=A0A2H3BCI7_9AGAR|nr:hypothetical protein ARMSODRAFT_663063 [Armillaria solidipes]